MAIENIRIIKAAAPPFTSSLLSLSFMPDPSLRENFFINCEQDLLGQS